MPLALIQFAKANGIECDEKTDAKTLSDAMQKAWFQKDKLRYQITGSTADEKAPPSGQNLELLREMGFIKEIRFWSDPDVYEPSKPIVFILGALLSRVNDRLAWHMEMLAKSPLPLDAKVYFLGSARPLDPVKESREALLTPHPNLPVADGWQTPQEMPNTEAGMMRLVAERAGLRNAIVIDTPMQPKEGGGVRAPNTGDTVREWFKLYGAEEDLLYRYFVAVSNNPFIQYQALTVKRALTETAQTICDVHGTGPEASMLPLATFRDNVAKQIYEELEDLRIEREVSAESRELYESSLG